MAETKLPKESSVRNLSTVPTTARSDAAREAGLKVASTFLQPPSSEGESYKVPSRATVPSDPEGGQELATLVSIEMKIDRIVELLSFAVRRPRFLRRRPRT